jgi:hypothetical protein
MAKIISTCNSMDHTELHKNLFLDMDETGQEYSRRYKGESSSKYQYPVILDTRHPAPYCK